MSVRAIALVITLAASAAASTPARAFECTHAKDTCFVNLRWSTRTIPYVVRVPPADSRIDRETFVRLTEQAFQSWQSISCTDLEFQLAGVLEEGEPTEVKNEIRIVTQSWPQVTETDRNPAGLTRVAHNTLDGTIARARIFINEQSFPMVDAERSCDRGQGELDLGAVLTHEVGHFIGFAHPCEPEDDFIVGEGVTKNCPTVSCDRLINSSGSKDLSTLWPVVDACDTSARSLNTSDTEGVCFLYPAGEQGGYCEALPEPSVSNAAFGCSAVGTESAGGAGAATLLAMLLLCYIGRAHGSARRVDRSGT